MAGRIVRGLGVKLPRRRDPTHQLEYEGWVHVMDNGLVVAPLVLRPPTQAQLDRLFALALAHPSMRERLMDALRLQREVADAS
jgi:hypothetical protein